MGLLGSPALHSREGPNHPENVKVAGRCLSLGTDAPAGSCDSDMLLAGDFAMGLPLAKQLPRCLVNFVKFSTLVALYGNSGGSDSDTGLDSR